MAGLERYVRSRSGILVGVPNISTLPLLYSAGRGGNYQIAPITALILLVASIPFMLFVERFLKAELLSKI